MSGPDGTSMEGDHSDSLRSSFKDALVATVNSCIQRDFLTAFRDLDEYHNKLYNNFSNLLRYVLNNSLNEFGDIMDEQQIPAQLAHVSALSESRGIVPRPYKTLQAEALSDRLAAKTTEKEHLKQILETALQEQDALSEQLERKKSAAAALRADIAAMGEEYREVQGEDSRWRSRNLLSM